MHACCDFSKEKAEQQAVVLSTEQQVGKNCIAQRKEKKKKNSIIWTVE